MNTKTEKPTCFGTKTEKPIWKIAKPANRKSQCPPCVGLAQKISVRCNMGSYVFSFSFICIFIPFLVLSHMYVFLIPSVRSLRVGSRLWKANIDQNWNLFYHYLFQRTPVIYNFTSQENVYLFAIYFH